MRQTTKQLMRLSIWLFVCGIATAQVQIPEGTRLRVRLEEDLSSASAQEGQPVRLSVVDEVKVGDAVVIAPGATVTGRVTEVVPKRFTKSGKLDFSVDRVAAADGEKILLRYSREKKNAGGLQSGIVSAGATMMLGPAGMLIGMMRAKDATLERGLTVEVFTDEVHTFKAATPAGATEAAQGKAEPEAAPTEPPVELVDVSVNSTPDGAKVTVDGMDVGDTPASFRVKTGDHEIQIEKEGFAVWKQQTKATAGAPQNIEATLAKPPVPKPAVKPAAKPTAKPATRPAGAQPSTATPKAGGTRSQ
jgi:PEGA domain-containing protein